MAKRKKKLTLNQILQLQVPPLGEVTLCEGEEWEYTVEIKRPVGARWLKLYPQLANYVFKVAEELYPDQPEVLVAGDNEIAIEERDVDLKAMFEAMETHFGSETLKRDLMPAVFGTHERPELNDYFEAFVGPNEFMPAFLNAAMMIISYNQGREDVVEAQKKLPDANNGADQVQ